MAAKDYLERERIESLSLRRVAAHGGCRRHRPRFPDLDRLPVAPRRPGDRLASAPTAFAAGCANLPFRRPKTVAAVDIALAPKPAGS